MSTIEEIIRVYRVERLELQGWIDQRLLRPQQTPQGYIFDEIDEARLALIRELRQDLLINDEALGVVLNLLDQVYAARRLLHEIEKLIGILPEPVRQQLRSRLPTAGIDGVLDQLSGQSHQS